jgi:2-polyprenyl-3-methyl-5-hydroxy-6-metoxy-1,4-benzoquinol methylase
MDYINNYLTKNPGEIINKSTLDYLTEKIPFSKMIIRCNPRAEPRMKKSEGLLYWTSDATYKGRVRETFGNSLPQINQGIILDWGCSEGLTTQELCEIYPNSIVIGIDIDPERILAARLNRSKGSYYLEDGYKSNFADGNF